MVVRSFEGPSISIAHRPATQIIRQPTESCSGQTSPSPHTQYPPIHPHPSSPSSLAVHNGDKLEGICSVQGRKDTPTLCQIVSPVLKKRQKIFLCLYIPILMRKDQWEIVVSQEFVLMSWSRLNSRTQRPESWEIQCRLLLKKYLKSLWMLQQSRRAYGKSKRYQRCDLIDTLQPTIFESWEKGDVIRVCQGDY